MSSTLRKKLPQSLDRFGRGQARFAEAGLRAGGDGTGLMLGEIRDQHAGGGGKNQPKFPSTVLKPGQTFKSTTVHKFGVQK